MLHFSQRLSATRERWSRILVTYCASYSKAHDLTIALDAICDELAAELGPVGGKNYVHGFTASVALFE